jgi:hypothetical protein
MRHHEVRQDWHRKNTNRHAVPTPRADTSANDPGAVALTRKVRQPRHPESLGRRRAGNERTRRHRRALGHATPHAANRTCADRALLGETIALSGPSVCGVPTEHEPRSDRSEFAVEMRWASDAREGAREAIFRFDGDVELDGHAARGRVG